MLLELNQQEAEAVLEAMLGGEGHPHPLHSTAVVKLEQALAVERGSGGEFPELRADNRSDDPEQMNGGDAS